MIDFLILTAGLAAVPTELDVLANFKAGKMICSNPDDAAKTCTAIARYEIAADGTLAETTELLLSPQQPITVTLTVRSRVENGAICGSLQNESFETGQIKRNAAPLPAEQNAAAMANIKEKLSSMVGRTACESLRIENGKLVKAGVVDGVGVALPAKPVRWISSLDGYRVAPAS